MAVIADRGGRKLGPGDRVQVDGKIGRFVGPKVDTFGFVAVVSHGAAAPRSVHYTEPSAQGPYVCPDLTCLEERGHHNAEPTSDEVPFAWKVTVEVERRGCAEARKTVTATGDVLAPVGRGAAFGAAALRRAMHLSSQDIAGQVRQMVADGGTGG
jgi:hypothetical protein